jgi:hypothetical protein
MRLLHKRRTGVSPAAYRDLTKREPGFSIDDMLVVVKQG